MTKANIGDIELYYETLGSGEPLILISGFSADHNTWRGVQDALAKSFQVIVFDNRGVGQTTAPESLYTTDLMADDVIGLMNHLNIQKGTILGHSMGGAIASSIAANHPDRLHQLIISNSSARSRNRFFHFAEGIFHILEQGTPPQLLFNLFIPWLFSEQFLENEPDRIQDLIDAVQNNPFPITLNGFRGQLEALKSMDISSFFEKIQTPTLVIASEEDHTTPKDHTQEIASNIQNAKLEILPGGHLPQVEAAPLFVEKVCTFLRSS